MQLLDGRLILSPSDLSSALACRHLSRCEFEVANGSRERPPERKATTELISRMGDEHENAYLDELRSNGLEVVTIESTRESLAAIAEAEKRTAEAMQHGASVIFQATFFDGEWRGHADFLERVERPSGLGPFSYEVVDAKLARHTKVSALLQTANYSEHVQRLQGVAPVHMHIQLGDGRRETFRVADFEAYYRAIKESFDQRVAIGLDAVDTYPLPVAHCSICEWAPLCEQQREDDDHPSLVAGVRRSQTQRLATAGITTSAQLAATELDNVPGLGNSTLRKLKAQARLQVQQRRTGDNTYELLEPGRKQLIDDGDNEFRVEGLVALPPPSPGDLFFDMEGYPYGGVDGLEYLFGVTKVEAGTPEFRGFWGHDPAGEKQAFEQFIDFVMAELAADPTLHIFHYADYEVTALKKLAARHNTREAEVDQLLRGQVLVDLYRVVRQGLRISASSYSIKKLEPFYMPSRQTAVTGGADSIVAYQNWLDGGDQSILDDIEAYNKDDCESTWLLREWLEDRRKEAEVLWGELPRPGEVTRQASKEVSELDAQLEALQTELLADPDAVDFADRQLLYHLLQWHRRETKAAWFRFFDAQKLGMEDLYEDYEALVLSEYIGEVGTEKRSIIHRYRFDNSQQHKLSAGKGSYEPRLVRAAGDVVAVDNGEGIVDLKRGSVSMVKAESVKVLIPPGPISADAQQRALLALGRSVADKGLDGAIQFRAGIELLLRRPPRLTNGSNILDVVSAAPNAAAAAVELAAQLDCSTLAIQGPPGAGKTYAGARIVTRLIAEGKRVGITATGHKVVGNMLDAIVEADAEKSVRIVQKCHENQRCSSESVRVASSNDNVFASLDAGEVDVVGGTAWLFARKEFQAEPLDVLIIDEAGQMSLADVLAISGAAKSIILLGDPQQLAQPSAGVHPLGAEASALGHLLDGHQTIPSHLGLLMDKSWRMHPDVAKFVSDAYYEARLGSVAVCSRQRISGSDEWSGAGLRYLPVEHAGNKTSSPEEAVAVAGVFDRLIGRTWTDRDGDVIELGIADILVVAPYNAQVQELRSVLPEGARVGTVDKFQGQEAAVVVYSLAVSSPGEISRGMDFLYSGNRLNVAVSRAMCMSVLVFNPELLTVECKRPHQAALANAFCRYVELATPVSVA